MKIVSVVKIQQYDLPEPRQYVKHRDWTTKC